MGQLDTSRRANCELCAQDGGILLHSNDAWRVIRASDADHPAFYRVIWNDHVAEWTDLSAPDRTKMMSVVEAIEQVLREQLQPNKINLATLGNVVPHLHWHVIARFDWDARWPAPVWAPAHTTVPQAEAKLKVSLQALDLAVKNAVSSLPA